MKFLSNTILVLLAAVGLAGCAAFSTAVSDIPKIDTFYKRDLHIRVGKHQGEGILVLPHSRMYEIELSTGRSSWRSSSGDMDVVRITSCHRQEIHRNKGKKFTYMYKRQPGIEDKGACPLRIETFDTDGEHHHAAYIDFESPSLLLPATVHCDGQKAASTGVSICQGHHGLVQKIVLEWQVKIFGSRGRCKIDVPEQGMVFEFKMAPKRCQYGFKSIGGLYHAHKLVTLGYDSTLLGEI